MVSDTYEKESKQGSEVQVGKESMKKRKKVRQEQPPGRG